MGATFETYIVKNIKSNPDLEKEHDRLREEAQYDHGHSGYSGTIAESPGLTIISLPYNTKEDAEEGIHEQARKWKNSLAATWKGAEGEWLIGGVYSD